MHAPSHICMHIHIYICICVFIDMCMCMCMCMHNAPPYYYRLEYTLNSDPRHRSARCR